MSIRKAVVVVAALLASGLGMGSASAADLPAKAAPPPPQVAPTFTGWRFTATAYGWATGLDGSVGVGRLPAANVDVPFSDILDKLDGAFMGSFFGNNGTWMFGLDLIWNKLSSNVDLKEGDGPLAQFRSGTLIKYKQEQTVAGAIAGYRLPIGPENLELYATAGVRYQRLNVKLQLLRQAAGFDREYSGTQEWVDPIVGLSFKYSFNEKWFLTGLGDIGGFGVGSNFTSQGLLAVGYNWNQWLSTSVGYRALYTDYKNDNANGGSFRYDTTLHGPFATLSFHF